MKREIFVGGVGIGGKHPVSIQSMTSTSTLDVTATLDQIRGLEKAGCEIVRVAVPGNDAPAPFSEICRQSPLPVIADIHFDARLAIKSIEAGASGIRINPGNIGSKEKLKDIIKAATDRDVPIRIGVNAGSLEKKYLHEGGRSAESMVLSALDHVKFFEDNGFFNMKLSLKSSSVKETVAAYRQIDRACHYPLHLGITEAGTFLSGTVKSAVGLGALLLEGIGDTLRVSLTADPVEEVKVAKEILRAVGLRQEGIEIISCPTCSRTGVDLLALAGEVEARVAAIQTNKKIKLAVMGCEVNGPGEASEADLGLAFSKDFGYIFKKGRMIEKVPPARAVDRLLEVLREFL